MLQVSDQEATDDDREAVARVLVIRAFTSFQGTNGVRVDGMQHETEALPTSDAATGTSEAEQYVFYRGLMRTVAQPSMVALSNDALAVVAAGPAPIQALFVLDMKASTARFTTTSNIDPGARELSLAAIPERPKAVVVGEIEQAMTSALVARGGLFADEARAMVRTWSETWFSAEVTREDAFTRMAKLGRFIEPAVRSIAQRRGDPKLAEAESVILLRLRVGGA